MLDTFAALYPTLILAVGLYTAVGALIGGTAMAFTVAFNMGGEDIVPRLLFAGVINAVGCFGAVVALAWTKYFLGV